MYSFMLISVLIVGLLSSGHSLVAYDCSSVTANITTIAIDKIRECSLDTNDIHHKSLYVQILKEQEISTASYIECKVLKSSIITHCGMHSHASMTKNSLSILEPVSISPGVCHDMYSSAMYVTPYNHRILNLKINSTTYTSLTELGVINSDSRCHGTAFTIDDTTYTDSVLTSHYSITVKKKSAVYYHMTAQMKFYDGTSCVYKAGNCIISESSMATWIVDTKRSSCGTSLYTVLYEGNANITQSSTSPQVLIVETLTQRFAMALKDQAIMCGHNGYKTGDETIIVLVGNPSSLPTHETTEIIDLNAFHNMDLKLVYLERNIMNHTTDLYRVFTQRYCELTRSHLHSLISLARSNAEDFAWIYMNRLGYTSVVRGEVLYLIQCKSTRVRVIPSQKCYQELVVKTSQNATRYVKPSTHILVDMGTEIECSAVIPPMFNIEGTWIRVGSEITLPIPPVELTAQPSNSWSYGDMVTLGKLGILSDQQLSQYRTAVVSPLEQPSILSTFSRRIGSHLNYHGDIDDFASAINTQKLTEDISNNILYKMYGWWEFIIRHLAGILGFAILWNILLSICSCIVNLTLLYKRFGFSSLLFFSVWSAMSKHILYGNIFKRNKGHKDINDKPSAPTDETSINNQQLTDIALSLYPNLETEMKPLTKPNVENDGRVYVRL